MNVSALRKDLEELEQAGYGGCQVEVYPCMDEVRDGKVPLDFVAADYWACDIRVPGPPDEGFVSLLFCPEGAADGA